jgi:hypothetical protein
MHVLSSPRIIANPVGDRNPPGYWTLEKTVTQLRAFCNENDLRDKSISLTLKNCNPKLSAAVNSFGGFKKLNKKFKLGLRLGRVRCLKISVKKLQISDDRKKQVSQQKKRIKWSKEKVIQEYRTIYLRKGKFPSTLELQKMGRSGLSAACYKFFKNTAAIREILSISNHRKQRNYWTLSNTVRELKQFIDASPDHKKDVAHKLRIQNRYGLTSAIYKHGGLNRLDKKFGLNLGLRKKMWSKREVLQELKTLSDSGVLITQANLAALDRNDLSGATNKFGGLNLLKTKLGLPVNRQNYWTDEVILKELKPLVASFGRIPSRDLLKIMGKGDLAFAMKKRGSVKKFSDILNVCSMGYFKANDNHYLNSGYECLFDNILFKYNIPHSVNGLITSTSKHRYDFLIGNTYIEICGYDKKEHPDYFKRLLSKKRLYQRLNLKCIVILKGFFKNKFDVIEKETLEIVSDLRLSGSMVNTKINNDIIPTNYWKDLKNVERELLPLVKKYGRIPFDRELRKEKKSPLIHGVYKYHGSFYEVAKKLNLKIRYKPKGFYTEENAVNEYKQLCIKHGRFLTLQELQQMRYFGLLGYISKTGGFYKIRKLTNLTYKQKQLPKGYYTPDKAMLEYKQLCTEKGRFISANELLRMQRGSLAGYIVKNGGYYIIRQKTGLNFPGLPKPKIGSD